MTERLDSARLKEVEEFLANSGYDIAKTNRLSENQQYLLPAAGHAPIQIFSGEGVNDEVVTTEDGKSVDFVDGLLDSLRDSAHYDYVMIYDPAKCQVRFLDEIEQKDGSVSRKMRAAISKSGVKFMDASGETNLVTQLLKENVLNPFEGLMPDRVLLELIEKLTEEEKSKVLLIIDDAGDFIFTEQSTNQTEMLPSMNRVINRSLINSLAKKLRNYPGSKIVLIDRRGKLACLKGNNLRVRHVGTPERAELQPLVKEKITSEKWKMGVELARGIALSKVRRILARHQGDESELLATLKKFKEEEITRLSGGSVKCNMDEYTREMVAMAEDESIFWDELAIILKSGQKNELLPQGILLVGPPGTGKSVRAKYLASSMGVPYLELNNISSSGLRGIKEDRVRQAFEAAMAVKPCILFVDEIDKYLPRTEGQRSGVGAENDDSEVAAYIQRMMDSKEMNGVVIVGAGNNPDQMNEAMLRNGRFGLRVAVLSPKNLEEKVSIFKAVMKQLGQTRHLLINDQLLEQLLMQPQFQDANGADYHEMIRRGSLKQSVQTKKGFWTIFCQELKTFKLRKNTKITEMEERSREMHTAPFELKESESQDLPTALDLKEIFALAETLDQQQLEEDKKKMAELEERREKARLAAVAIEKEKEQSRLTALATKQNAVSPVQIVQRTEVQNTNSRELSPIQTIRLLTTLAKRFHEKNKHYKNPKGIKWEDIQRALENSPEKLWSLNEMERTGGEPDVVEYDKKTGEFVFIDCSAESPTGRRNCVYNKAAEEDLKIPTISRGGDVYPGRTCNGNAVDIAAAMGIEILDHDQYENKLQKLGNFDRESSSWIRNYADDERSSYFASSGHRYGNKGILNYASYGDENRAFRGALRVLLKPLATPIAQKKEIQKTDSRELSPIQTIKLLTALAKRFHEKNKHYKNPEGIEWEDIQTALGNSPEKLWSLNEMERTGGEPDVMEYDKKTGEYIFIDCSAESPTGRRECVYDKEREKILKRDYLAYKCEGNAVSRAALMGINLLSESEYRELLTKGDFDKNSWSWLKTPLDKRRTGVMLFGMRSGIGVDVREYDPGFHPGYRGFRGSLRVSAPIAQAKETQQTNSRELSLEMQVLLLATLKNRFEAKDKHYKNPKGIKWEDVQRALEKSPEKLWSLGEMEGTGGEPDLVKYDKKTGEYIFIDCSAESPEGRRNCVYDREGEETLKGFSPNSKYNSNAISRAALMGVNLLSESEYQDLQTIGKFDKESANWLKTPLDKRRTSAALCGVRHDDVMRVHVCDPYGHVDHLGFRASLRVSVHEAAKIERVNPLTVDEKEIAAGEQVVVAKLDLDYEKNWEKTLGRGPNCDIVINGPGTQGMSEPHILLKKLGNKITVEDFCSTNGTYIKGKRLMRGDWPHLEINERMVLGGTILYIRENGEVVMVR